MVRIYNQHTVGIWELYLMITTLLEMARNGLVQNAIVKFTIAAGDLVGKNIVISSGLLLNIGYTLITSLIILIIYLFRTTVLSEGSEDLAVLMLYFVIVNFIFIAFAHFSYIQLAFFSFNGIFFSNLTRQGLFFITILSIYWLKIEVGLTQLVFFQAAYLALGAILNFLFSRKFIELKFIFRIHEVVRLLAYGKFVFGTTVSSMLFKAIDKIMVYSLMNSSSVALYTAAIRMLNLFEYPATAMAEVVFPKSSDSSNQNDLITTKRLFEKSVGLLLAFIIPGVALIWFFSDEIILFINGSSYSESATILKVIIFFGIFTPFTRQFGIIMDSMGLPQWNFVLLIASSLISLLLNYILIKNFGLIGAAYGTLLSVFINFLAGQFILRNLISVSILSCFKYQLSFYRDLLRLIRSKLIP